jgi:hypothetical protein
VPSDKKFGSLFGAVVEAAAKGAQMGKAQLDLALAKRERLRALAELGERVVEAVDAGKMKVGGALADAMRRVKEAEAKIADHERKTQTADGTVSSRDAKSKRPPKPAEEDDDDLQ